MQAAHLHAYLYIRSTTECETPSWNTIPPTPEPLSHQPLVFGPGLRQAWLHTGGQHVGDVKGAVVADGRAATAAHGFHHTREARSSLNGLQGGGGGGGGCVSHRGHLSEAIQDGPLLIQCDMNSCAHDPSQTPHTECAAEHPPAATLTDPTH